MEFSTRMHAALKPSLSHAALDFLARHGAAEHDGHFKHSVFPSSPLVSCRSQQASSFEILLKYPHSFRTLLYFSAGGSRPFAEVSRLLHGSSEELPHDFGCHTHGNSVTAPEDFVHGLIGPSSRAVTSHFSAFGQLIAEPSLPVSRKDDRL
ncbi:hypothetical protein PoB_003022200 [Plakobranchus ocellatus]|uniref:Uncharacterized protein n=1 Tax=Plakobranchus ocellatus TaxID=259542 RepID=A0AAV4AA02_9GAST|nr:hypothetical protein PoB_003022200 [Plakobranchus ocellatus]